MTRSAEARRPLAVITGACGGMGLACARVFARHHRLVLTDVSAERLASLAAQLTADGAVVAAQAAGDISGAEAIAAIAQAVEAHGPLGALVHTAGLSPALAPWDRIVEVNLSGTVRLLDALEPRLAPGAAAVLIASIAGHKFTSKPEIDALLADAGAPGLAERARPHLEALAGGADAQLLAATAYGFSKYGVIRLCEQRAGAWGARGARIVSISPGMISTPMGRKEVDENELASSMLKATPAGGWGAPLDIASAAEFLASDLAGFVSGCDLRVDGGLIGALNASASA